MTDVQVTAEWPVNCCTQDNVGKVGQLVLNQHVRFFHLGLKIQKNLVGYILRCDVT